MSVPPEPVLIRQLVSVEPRAIEVGGEAWIVAVLPGNVICAARLELIELGKEDAARLAALLQEKPKRPQRGAKKKPATGPAEKKGGQYVKVS